MIPFPDKKYSVIYADPPWNYAAGGATRNAERHYKTITKTAALDSHARKAGKNVVQYVGIAADEPKRLRRLEENKVAPLADWGITEADALRLCYEGGTSGKKTGSAYTTYWTACPVGVARTRT